MEAQFETQGLSIRLQLDRRRLAGRGLERRPAPPAREARRPTRGTPEECADVVLVCIYIVQSAVEPHSNSLSESKNNPTIPSGPARLNALGRRGRTPGRGAPLTPRPRGTIYEAPPFIFERVWEGPRWRLHSKHCGYRSVSNLTAVARPAAAWSGAPNHIAGGPQGRLAASRKDVRTLLLSESDRSHLQLNDISVSALVPEDAYQNSS
jgi:hypothetical protein